MIDQDVINDLERLAKLLRAPEKMLEAVRELNGFDNAIGEKQSQLAELVQKIEAARSEVPKAKADSAAALAKIRAEHDDAIARINTEMANQERHGREAAERTKALQAEVARLEEIAANVRASLAAAANV